MKYLSIFKSFISDSVSQDLLVGKLSEREIMSFTFQLSSSVTSKHQSNTQIKHIKVHV